MESEDGPGIIEKVCGCGGGGGDDTRRCLREVNRPENLGLSTRLGFSSRCCLSLSVRFATVPVSMIFLSIFHYANLPMHSAFLSHIQNHGSYDADEKLACDEMCRRIC